jgi:Nickel responsive protein SCO4226-like
MDRANRWLVSFAEVDARDINQKRRTKCPFIWTATISKEHRHTIANAHEKDLAVQRKYGVNFLTYWFDEARSTAFCLVEAPTKEAIRMAHDEAHGAVPNEIIEVDPTVVEAFLGRVKDPLPTDSAAGSYVPREACV